MKSLLLGVSIAVVQGLSALAADTDTIDYNLASGDSDTLSTNSTYATMNIAGDLRVDSNGITRFKTANINGGTVTLDGAKTLFGVRNDQSSITVDYDQNGKYGKVILQNGTFGGMSDPTYKGNTTYNLGPLWFNIATNANSSAGNNGYVDFLYMNNAGAHFKPLNNYSSLTGRVTIAGNALMTRSWGYNYGNSIFNSGNFLVDIQNNSTINFDFGNQMGTLSTRDVRSLRFVGNGSVILGQQINDYYPIEIRDGTKFDYNGELVLRGDDGVGGMFVFSGDDNIGTNITKIASSSNYSIMHIYSGRKVELCGDLDLSNGKSILSGEGSFKLNCSAAPRSFKANAPEFYSVNFFANSPTLITNFVQVIKTGINEATFVSTNLVNLFVKEGVVRFVEKDCTIKRLQMNTNTEVIADGCTITLTEKIYKRPNIRAINGGKVVFVSDGTITCGSMPDSCLRIKSGEVKFKDLGRTEKYWRFVFKGMDGNPGILRIKNLYFFDANHELQGMSAEGKQYYSYKGIIYDDEWTDLAENGVRWRCNSATNIADTGVSWCNASSLYHLGCTYWNGNNSAALTSPVINREDPTSYLAFELRLGSEARPVTGYNLLVSTDKATRPDTWDVYCSHDGQEWTLVDSQSCLKCHPQARADSGWKYTYNSYQTIDGVYYNGQQEVYKGSVLITKYPGPTIQYRSVADNSERISELLYFAATTNGLAATKPIKLQVDPAATLDLTAFTEATQVIDELTVDMMVGGGKIKGGQLAANGKIHLENIQWNGQKTFPFEFDGTEGIANLANWPVLVNGITFRGNVSYDSENKQLVFDGALVNITESVKNGDLQGTYPNQNLNINLGSGVVYTNLTALTGNKGITLFGAGQMVLTQESPNYSGEVGVVGGVIEGIVSNAFGTGTITISGSTTASCMVKMGSSTQNTSFDNNFVLLGNSSRTYPALWFSTFKSRKAIVLNGSITANGYLAMADNRCGDGQGYYLVTINGDVNAAGQTIMYSPDNFLSWKGKVKAAIITTAGYAFPTMGTHRFYNSENEIGQLAFYYVSCAANAENAFGGAILTGLGESSERGRGFFEMNGFNQTVKGVAWEEAYLKKTYPKDIRNSNMKIPVTLTITGGVEKAVTYAIISGSYNGGTLFSDGAGKRLSITVAAGNDDFIQEFTNSVSTTYGDVIVSNGCLRLSGYSSMKNVPKVAVEGGSFELLSTNDCALASVTNVTIGADAIFKVAAKATTPFGANSSCMTVLNMATSGTLNLAEGAIVEVRKAFVNGKRLDAGTYSGVADVEGQIQLPQIIGKGTLKVLTGGGMIFILK